MNVRESALASAAHTSDPDATEIGAVTSSPGLPEGFDQTFRSRFVQANGLRQHVVTGGDGPPILLLHGWPQTWYAWRYVMSDLVADFQVIAPDQRGIGLSEITEAGYDTGTLAMDAVALMSELGHDKFAVVGHDTGLAVAYALAADHRDRVDYLAVAEVSGPPGVTSGPPLFVPEPINNRLWHIPFNRVADDLIVDMVHSHASAFFRYEFMIQGGGAPLPESVIDYYVGQYNRSKAALRASFAFYRAWDTMMTQNALRASDKLTIPVLGIGGDLSWGRRVAEGMRPVAEDVHAAVIPGAGHWIAEQAPTAFAQALRSFLARRPAEAEAAGRLQ